MICCICLAAGTVHVSRCFSFILGTFAAVLKQNEMRKMYLSAPLPFVGQKRMFAKEFIKVLGQFPDSTVFVDLFGGSGLLSHITKCVRPDAVVVYNDFDNYRQRLANIPVTNVLLLNVLNVLKGHAFVYFTSNKSSILELCDWMGRNPFLGNPFKECRKVEFSANVNYQAKYTDMMLYTVPDEEQTIAA